MAVLTDSKARNTKPDDKPLPHGGIVGLRLIPTKERGCGRWELRFVSPSTGKRRDMGLGSYPAVSVKQAGLLGQDARDKINQGIDPIECRQATALIAAPKKIPTFHELVLAKGEDRRLRIKNPDLSMPKWFARFDNHAPLLLSKPIDQVSVDDICAAIKPLWTAQPATADKLKTAIGQIMDWAEANDYIEASPMAKVVRRLGDPHKVAVVSHPSMPYQLIPAFIKERVLPLDNVTKSLLLFTVLTAVRSVNARGAEWQEFDLEANIWTIPAHKMKSLKGEGFAFTVPITSGVRAILECQRGQHPTLVFPSPRGLALSNMVLTAFLRQHAAISDTPGRVATGHGFRSSFKTWSMDKDFNDDLSEMAIAHVIGSAARRAYARSDMIEQRRVMMQAWCDYVTQLGGVA